MAADIAAGLDGLRRELSPPPPIEADPYAAEATALPSSFAAGIDALAADPLYREQFGDGFLDYYLMMKRAELARFTADVQSDPPADEGAVSAWEMREYFEMF